MHREHWRNFHILSLCVVAIPMEGTSCDKLSTMVLPTHETGQVTDHEGKQVEVDEGLPTIELHGPPVNEIAA